MINFNVILFNDFETLDVFGPVEVVGRLEKYYRIEYYSVQGGIIRSSQNARVETLPVSKIEQPGILLIPGGSGTRSEVNNLKLIRSLKDLSMGAQYVLTVCTGSALLAKTGLLKNVKATTNKMAFDWVVEQDRDVQWIRKARWVVDGKFYTSSGVSAGIDMTLGFVRDMMGEEVSDQISRGIEYIWNSDKDKDTFAVFSS
jgi:transcriptional regulator GlxA family with amidase domain